MEYYCEHDDNKGHIGYGKSKLEAFDNWSIVNGIKILAPSHPMVIGIFFTFREANSTVTTWLIHDKDTINAIFQRSENPALSSSAAVPTTNQVSTNKSEETDDPKLATSRLTLEELGYHVLCSAIVAVVVFIAWWAMGGVCAFIVLGLMIGVVVKGFGADWEIDSGSGSGTKRPLNGCENCGYTWFPRGHDRSSRCPNCRR